MSNSSTINPSVTTNSSASNTSSSDGGANTANIGMSSAITTPLTSSLNSSGTSPRMNPGMNLGMNPSMNPGMNSGIDTGSSIGMNPGLGPGTESRPSLSSTFSGPQSRLTVNPSSMNLPPSMTNMNLNPGMGPDGMNSGLGMQSIGINSANQMPQLQHQTPDVYSAPTGMGGAGGPSMMNQNPQGQQTQVIWSGSIEVSEGLRDGARLMCSVKCSITAKVSTKPTLKPELWPPKMILQAYPRSIYTSVLQQLKSRAPITTTLVTFNFLQPITSINTLKMLTSAEQQRLGIVQLLGVPQHCPVKLMILTGKNQQFVGNVPSEQERFLMTFRQTLEDFQNGIAIPANLRPQIKQLLERSTPEEKRRTLEELKSRQMRQQQQQQQQQFQAQMVSAPRMGQKIITKRILLAYQLAMKTGTRKSNQLKLVMLGAEGAGKTSSVQSLLGKKFNDNEASTVGASINCCLTDRIFVSRWQQILMADQLDNLPKIHKSNVKTLMPKMSPQVEVELHSATSNTEEAVSDVVAAHVQECVNAKEVTDGDVRIVILDLGGQEIYYEVHFLFLAPEDIVLLTFDASKALDQPVICRQRIDRFQEKVATRGMQTNLEMLETLFQSVYSHCGRAVVGYISNRIPTIIMMATHSKGLTDQQKSAIKMQFCKCFSGKPFFNHLPREFEDAFHFIDNKFRDPEVFERVKEVVLRAAKNSIEQECPISYLEFETKLLKASEDKPIISLQEAKDIATAAGIEQDQLREVLLHYAYKGVLLYYPDVAALQQEVFVHPQEVSDLVSSVISTHDCQPSSADLNNSCTRYDTYGLLEERLLDDLLKKCGRLQQKKMILALLQKFDLAVEVPMSTKFFDEDDSYDPPNSGRVFVVPSMLVYNKKNVYQKQAGDVVVLFHYPDKFLSENIFNHLLVRVIIWCNEEGHHIRRICRSNGYFNFKSRNQSFKLQECQATSSIKCYITINEKGENEEEELVMLEQRQALLTHLKESIIEVHKVYIPSARDPIGYIECPLQHEEHCGPHVRLKDISETGKVYCSKSDGKVVPPHAYMMLLTANTGHSTTSVSGTSVSSTDILTQDQPNHRNLLPYFQDVNNWKQLGLYLLSETSTPRINDIEKNYPHDVAQCRWELITEYLKAGKISWSKVIDAFEKSGHPNIAKKIRSDMLNIVDLSTTPSADHEHERQDQSTTSDTEKVTKPLASHEGYKHSPDTNASGADLCTEPSTDQTEYVQSHTTVASEPSTKKRCLVMQHEYGVMTSQPTITVKVSTSLAGIQPINKLLTERSNSSTINPSVTTNSSASNTSSSNGAINNSITANFGMSSAITTPLTSSLNFSGTSRINPGMNPGMDSEIGTGSSIIMNPGLGPGTASGPSSSSTFSGPQSRLTVSMNPSSMVLPPSMTNMGSGMSPSMGPGSMNSGLGMQSMGMNSANQMSQLQHQTPNVISTPTGMGGAAGPAMMNQNPQGQQTQVIWSGSIEVTVGLRDGAREMRSVKCSITAKVSTKPTLKPELWPPKMILQLYPRSIYTSVLQQLKSRAPITTTLVTFNFLEPVASINTLEMLTSAEQQRLGMVQLLGVPQHCPVKLMILTGKNQQFVGHVPSEQERFLMTFRQTLQDFQNGIAIPANLRPQIKQLLERSTPEEKRRILEELKSRQMRQQQQQFHAQMGGAMDHPIGMQQGGQSISMMGQPNMMQPMGLQQVRPMQNQPMGMPQAGQMQSQPMGMPQGGQLQNQPMGMQQGQIQSQPMGEMPQSNPSTDPNYFLNRN